MDLSGLFSTSSSVPLSLLELVTCIEASQIGVQAVLQEAPQRQNVAHWGGPVCQEIFHDVVDGRGPGQGPIRRAEPHILLCGGKAGAASEPHG